MTNRENIDQDEAIDMAIEDLEELLHSLKTARQKICVQSVHSNVDYQRLLGVDGKFTKSGSSKRVFYIQWEQLP